MDETREQKYADAIREDGHMLCCPEQVDNVMAVADAEIEAKADSIREHYAAQVIAAHRRAEKAEAEAKSLAEHLGREIQKVARVEALAERWEGSWRGGENAASRELRAALDGATGATGDTV